MKIIPGSQFGFLIVTTMILVVLSILGTSTVHCATEQTPSTSKIFEIITAPCPAGMRRDSNGRCRKTLN